MKKAATKHLDFAGISDQRAGSSWIYQCLKTHPEICMSTTKEAQLLTKRYNRFSEFYDRSFAHCDAEALRGEYSPQYIHEPAAAPNLKREFPDIKLISCLRDPVDRLTSIYWYNRIGGTGSSWRWDSFDEAARDPEFIKRTLYADKIEHFLEHFDRSQILFVLYDDLLTGPTPFMRDIYRFLNVDDTYISPYTTKRVLATGHVRIANQRYARIYFRTLRTLEHFPLTSGLVRWAKRQYSLMHIGRTLTPKRTQTTERVEKPEISDETRRYLRDYYRPDIERLETLIGKDLSSWK
ncbi:MAG: sulfotransferase [Candidatus Paceibacterota bacterium]